MKEKMDRRKFIQYMGTGVILLGSMPLISNAEGIAGENFEIRGKGKKMIPGLSKDEFDILYLASLAPSGHNAQPWTVTVLEPGHWIIGSAKDRWLPAVDPENRELFLSIGAFMENLIIAAGARGYEVETEIPAQRPENTEILNIRLTKREPLEYPLQRITTRRTVRNNYLNKDIKDADIRYLEGSGAEHVSYYPRESREGKYLREGTIEANRIQAYRDSAQVELSDWIRWSDKDAEKYRTGLTPESMEINGFAGWFVRHFFDRKSVLKKSFREKTIKTVVDQVKTSGGWLAITSKDSSIPSLIEAGRKFERIFLTARERMIAIHPMTQMLEELPMKNEAARELGVNGNIQFLLRIGYLESYPDPVSLRMPVSWFVKAI